MSAAFVPAELQGNIVRGYRRQCARHVMLEVVNAAAARKWLGATTEKGAEGVPAITTEEQWSGKPETCFNIGLTIDGLRALNVSVSSLATFPNEFVNGMASRAAKIGDIGDSAPSTWDAPFDQPARIHIIASLYADDAAHLDAVQQQIADAGGGRTFNVLGVREGAAFDGDYVHFGYRDNISQPRFKGVHDPDRYPDLQPLAPLGTVLLGHPTAFEGLSWRVPQPDPLGKLGSFNAFRILEQDVAGFEAFLDRAATELLEHGHAEELLPKGAPTRHEAMREVVAAKMCGRWRNGVPLELSPDTPDPMPEVSLTRFDYSNEPKCPYGAHTRRCNPRGGAIVQRVANHTRRLVRRGMPYGPAYDAASKDEKRGLLGNFLCANLGAQFEAVMCDWLNLGLQDPMITGSNDPLLGVNDPVQSWFEIPLKSGKAVRLEGLPRFINTKGGAYTFLPSIPAIRYLASLNG